MTKKPRRRKLKEVNLAELEKRLVKESLGDKRTKEHRVAVMSGQLKAANAENARLRKTNKALAALCLAYLEEERDR
jgi:cell division protein FtsB